VRVREVVELDLGKHSIKGMIIIKLSNDNISKVEKITLK